MSAASHTVQQVPENDGTNCSSDCPNPKQGKKLIPINICRQTVTATVTVWQTFVLYCLDHGHSTFLWQRATRVIVGWFVGCTWKNDSRSHTKCPAALLNFK